MDWIPMYMEKRNGLMASVSMGLGIQGNQILQELSREWPGSSYDLLSKNCNHFCDEFCERLGVQKLPGWVNRFANAGDAAIEIAETTALRLRQAKTEIVSASKVAYRFLVGVTSSSNGGNDSPGNSNSGSPRFQAAWFKNLITTGAKPSSSSEIEAQDGSGFPQHRQQNSTQTTRQNFQDSERTM
ncbi:putative receptor-like protein kinase [Hibiscus syriacus]|uniref:Receptor-like protein kinase n=1 Tax=Hibiscus syriacus TaxID=106335 RepID=A0A6A3BXL0_HIBSY|nr:putative receptor-like protein kinase [Hibiscus syriacus]